MHLFNWLQTGTTIERRTFWVCFAGWSIDAFDVQMMGLAIPLLISALGLTRGQAGLLPSVALLSTAVGGWVGGALCDRIGRVRTLQISILWFAALSLLTALAPNYLALFLLKGAQGLGFGAEWVAGAVLISEIINPKNRGKAMGAVQSGWAIGWGAAVLLFSLFSTLLPPALAWRALFAAGVAPALLVFIAQRLLVEPPRREIIKLPITDQLMRIFEPSSLRATLAGGLLGIGAHGGYYGLFTWLPTYLKTERHLTAVSTGGYLAVIIVAFGVGCLVSGQLLDWLGRRRTVAIFTLICIGAIAFYLLVPINNDLMLYLGFPLGFSAAGIPAAMGTLFSELFPQGLRGTGVGFCYNFGRLVAAACPALVGMLSDRIPLSLATGLVTVGAYSLVLVALVWLPGPTSAKLKAELHTA